SVRARQPVKTVPRTLLLIAMVVLVYPLGMIRAQEPTKGAPAKEVKARTKSRQAVVRPASDVKWKDLPEIEGVKRSVIWGNPERTAYGALESLPAGARLPLHWNTADVRVVVVSGTLVVGIEGKPARELASGSYYFLPGGLKHTRVCKTGQDCI